MKPDQKSKWPKVLGSVAMLAAIGGVTHWKWDAIVAHPATTALIGLGTAVLAALAAFGGKVRAKLEDKWVDSVADWIDAQVRLYGSLLLAGFGWAGFRRRYYRQLVYRHRFFNVRGLRTRGEYTPELEKIFVERIL